MAIFIFYIIFIFYFRIDRHLFTGLAKKCVILIPARVLFQTTAIDHSKIDSFWMVFGVRRDTGQPKLCI